MDELSMDAILSDNNEVDASSLLKLPKSDLIELVLASKEKNKETVENFKSKLANTEEEFKSRLAKSEEELANVRQNRYVVDPPLLGNRDGRSDLMKAICSKWTVKVAKDRSDAGEQMSSSDLLSSGFSMLYDVKDRKHVLSSSRYGEVPSDTVKKHIVYTGSGYNPDFKNVYEVISSANLLYRLCCLFRKLPVDIEGPSGYKVVWTAYIKHKASGKVFGFSEWKGATLYRMPTRELEDEWVDDWIDLLDLLCSDHCPHPYDGVVAGGIA